MTMIMKVQHNHVNDFAECSLPQVCLTL